MNWTAEPFKVRQSNAMLKELAAKRMLFSMGALCWRVWFSPSLHHLFCMYCMSQIAFACAMMCVSLALPRLWLGQHFDYTVSTRSFFFFFFFSSCSFVFIHRSFLSLWLGLNYADCIKAKCYMAPFDAQQGLFLRWCPQNIIHTHTHIRFSVSTGDSILSTFRCVFYSFSFWNVQICLFLIVFFFNK